MPRDFITFPLSPGDPMCAIKLEVALITSAVSSCSGLTLQEMYMLPNISFALTWVFCPNLAFDSLNTFNQSGVNNLLRSCIVASPSIYDLYGLLSVCEVLELTGMFCLTSLELCESRRQVHLDLVRVWRLVRSWRLSNPCKNRAAQRDS